MEVLSIAAYGGTAVAYTVAAIAHLLCIYRRQWEELTRWSTRSAWLFHSLALLLVVVQTGRVPVYTIFEAALAVTWLLVLIYIATELIMGSQGVGAVLIPVTFVLILVTVALPKPAGREVLVANLPASLIVWHVSVTLLGYVFFTGAFVAGCMYLLLDNLLRRKAFHPIYYQLPSLESLDIWGHRAVAMGFPLLTLGLGAGLFFAWLSWREIWQDDPKIVWTMVNWGIYAGYLATRRLRGWGGRRAAWWAIIGFIGVLVNYFVVNTLLTDLHRFGV